MSPFPCQMVRVPTDLLKEIATLASVNCRTTPKEIEYRLRNSITATERQIIQEGVGAIIAERDRLRRELDQIKVLEKD